MAFSFTSPSPQFANPQQQQQQQQLFPQSTPFPSFSQPPPQQTPVPQFHFQPPQQQQQPPPPPQQQMLLYTKDKNPAGYNTKWEDLHPDSQKLLLQIEERILEYKDDSQRLDQCSRLYDSSVSSDGFELDASQIMQELGGISAAMEKEKLAVQELMNEVNNMLWNTEVAVRSYMMLRPRFLHPNVSATSNTFPASQSMGATINSSSNNQPRNTSVVPVYDFYIGIPKRPSPFMQHTVARFEKYLTECCQWIEELEQLVLLDTDKSTSSSGLSSLQSLPNIMSNVHDFFVHVAAKVESLHQYIESMKLAYLADQRRHGDGNDPFLEADRRETAKQEAAARRVHPTLHLPSIAQPSTQGAGLFASSGMPVSSIPQQPIGNSDASSGRGSSIFSTSASSSTSLFFTPTASASTSGLFGSTGFSPQSTLFGTTSASPFGTAQTSSLIGVSTPSVASTPAIGSSPLFSTPSFITGTAMGSGSSFGATSNKSRQKPRGTRR